VDGAGEQEDDAYVEEEEREVELEGVVAGEDAGGGDAGDWLEAEEALVDVGLPLLLHMVVRPLHRHAGLRRDGGERKERRGGGGRAAETNGWSSISISVVCDQMSACMHEHDDG
jgi:hypothetical protein